MQAQQPADPSYCVDPPLLQHVHLLSTNPFPYTPRQLSLPQAVDFLRNSNNIVRLQAPVLWDYLRLPRDGTILLRWQPTRQIGTTYATDGFVWAEPEAVFHQNFNGYGVEIRIQPVGFCPGREQTATHRRMRYRLVSSPAGEQVDTNLEIVHYLAAQVESQVATSAIPFDDRKKKLFQERAWLENAGQLPKRPFMLHDTSNWPRIEMPRQQQQPQMPSNPYQRMPMSAGGDFTNANRLPPNAAKQMYPQTAMRPAGGGPPPSKRPRQAPPMRIPGGGPVSAMEATFAAGPTDGAILADEDNPGIGDYLDLLSPRDVSIHRFKQHHEWMEEIISSPYSMTQIAPVQIRPQLQGELADLTKGLFPDASSNTNEPEPVKSEHVQEFERRVVDYRKRATDEIAALKASHAANLRAMRKKNLYAELEQRLAKLSADTPGDDAMKDIVREVEQATGYRLSASKEVCQVQKGGLLSNQEMTQNAPRNSGETGDEFGEFFNNPDHEMDSAGELLDLYSGNNELEFST